MSCKKKQLRDLRQQRWRSRQGWVVDPQEFLDPEFHRLTEARRLLTERALLTGTQELLDFDRVLGEGNRSLLEARWALAFDALEALYHAHEELLIRIEFNERLAEVRAFYEKKQNELPLEPFLKQPAVGAVGMALRWAEAQARSEPIAPARASLELAWDLLERWHWEPTQGLARLKRRLEAWEGCNSTKGKALSELVEGSTPRLAEQLLDELVASMPPEPKQREALRRVHERLENKARTVKTRIEAWVGRRRRKHGSTKEPDQ